MARVRLIQGAHLPIPPTESLDGRSVLTREGFAEVREGAWLHRLERRRDLERVPVTLADPAKE